MQGSGLDKFEEFTMFLPYPTEQYFGFTTEEVQTLCDRYGKPFEDIRRQYEGYSLDGLTIYNPASVLATVDGDPASVPSQTEDFESLEHYVDCGIRGVKTALHGLLAGKPIRWRLHNHQ